MKSYKKQEILKHVGVLGMRWGKRKASSTSDRPSHFARSLEQKYGIKGGLPGLKNKVGENFDKSLKQKYGVTRSDIAARKQKNKKKKLSEMSNEELKTLTTRLQLEKQYKDLTKTDLSFGQKFVSDVLVGAGKQLATKYVANAGESLIKSLLDLRTKKG